jgi:hypothetical protein
MARLRPWVISAALALLAAAPARGADKTLPLKKVRLYETGVGYFERSGSLGGKSATLPVPASHIDDALKTLVVLSDDGKSSVAGVEFGSSVSRSMARAMAGLSEDDGPLKLNALLKSLKGVDVEVKTTKASVQGRIVELVEAAESDLSECASGAKKGAGCVVQKVPTLVILTKAGEIRRFRVEDISGVRPTDPAYAKRLGSALDALSDRNARVLKALRVMTKSAKTVALGYVAEAPVWRVSYRLVLGGTRADEGVLQGWALLHNDTDEDWKGVDVDLVNGRPDSFLFPLAAPRYARRELVTPENPLSTVPQLMDQTPDSMWTGDQYGAGGLGLTGVGEGGGGSGEGIGLGSIGTLGHGGGSISGNASSSMLSVGNLAGIAPAEGVESGSLFRYSLSQPIDLRAHGSALVPFLSDGIAARKIAIFSVPGEAARSAVHLKHQGNQTLPEGTLAVFSDGGFAGESALVRMKPHETQVVRFGADLDVELSQTASRSRDETRLLDYRDGKLFEHFVRHHDVSYEIENRSGSGRDVFLKLDYVNNAKVDGADELAWDTHESSAFAVFKLAARTKIDKKVAVDEGLSRTLDPVRLGSRGLRRLAASKALPERQRKIALEAAERLLEAEVRRGGRVRRGAELKELEAEALRLREHARALGNARGAEGVVKRLLAAEDKAQALRKRLTELKVEADERTRRARLVLSRLSK